MLSPLGEETGRDPDPRFRLDAFDCTTFVETALALANEKDLADARTFMDQIRYRNGQSTFAERRHFMSSQWVPGLIGLGLVQDITKDIGQKHTEEIRLVLDHARWARRRVARSIKLPKEDIPSGTFLLPYVPIADIEEMLERVPPGTIVNIVRADSPRTYDVITHQGLIIANPKNGKLMVRHASPVAKRIIDEPLEHMIMRYQRPRKWPIVGMNFLRILP